MAIYNPLNWQNENSLTGYPLNTEIDPQDFIVDARFLQFDNFIPVLNYAQVNSSNIIFTITFDKEQVTTQPFLKSVYNMGASYRSLQIYNSAQDRYLGNIVIGSGALTLWNTSVGRKITFNSPFAAQTVRSIPSTDAVYTLDTNYGNVTLGRTSDDKTIFYNATHNGVLFNAVTNNSIDDFTINGLRKINLVSPVNNNITLAANDVIRVEAVNGASLKISLNTNPTSTAVVPTLAS
jgi:hypothetical protein